MSNVLDNVPIVNFTDDICDCGLIHIPAENTSDVDIVSVDVSVSEPVVVIFIKLEFGILIYGSASGAAVVMVPVPVFVQEARLRPLAEKNDTNVALSSNDQSAIGCSA
jgi:hypothetical protein